MWWVGQSEAKPKYKAVMQGCSCVNAHLIKSQTIRWMS